MPKEKIKGVYGGEPMRQGEYPAAMVVGFNMFGLDSSLVHNIETEEQNLGTYGILWFKAFRADGHMLGKMNAAQVSLVEYFREEVPSGQ